MIKMTRVYGDMYAPKDENVIASNIKSVPVEDILKEGMI